MTTDLTAQEIEDLKRLSNEAIGGAWVADRHETWAFPQTDVRTERDTKIVRFVNGHPQFWCTVGKAEYEWANAKFIAAANPDTVMRLLAMVEQLQGDVAAMTQLDVDRVTELATLRTQIAERDAEIERLKQAVQKVFCAKGRYHTQIALCDLGDLIGERTVRPDPNREPKP